MLQDSAEKRVLRMEEDRYLFVSAMALPSIVELATPCLEERIAVEIDST